MVSNRYSRWVIDGGVDTFQQFTMCILMRHGFKVYLHDKSPIPKYDPRRPSGWLLDQINMLKSELIRIDTLSNQQLVDREKSLLEDKKLKLLMIKEKKQRSREKLKGILREAKKWDPPESHKESKKIMIHDIENEISQHCSTHKEDDQINSIESEILKLNGVSIRTEMTKSLKDELINLEIKYNKDKDDCERMNKWASELIESISAPKPPEDRKFTESGKGLKPPK